MKKSVKFKDYSVLQKIGIVLTIIAAAIILAKIFNILEAGLFIEEDLPNYIFITGGLMVLLPHIARRIKGKKTSNKATLFLVILCTSLVFIAQDCTKQIAALMR